MSWFDTFKTRLAQLTGRGSAPQDLGDDYQDSIDEPQVEGSTTGPLGQLLVTILLIPFQLLFLPLNLLGIFHNSGVDVEFEQDYQEQEGVNRAFWTLKSFGLYLLKLPYLLATAPIRFFQGVASANTLDALFVIPAVSMVLFFGFVFWQVYFRADVIKSRYSKGAAKAVANEDFTLAKTYYNRLMQEGDLTYPMQLQLFLVLRRSGEVERAEEILDSLAPEDSVGFGPAHRLKAVRLAQTIAIGKENEKTLEQLKRHLNRTNQEDAETLQAWSIYHRKLGQHDEAVKSLTKAAEENPLLYIPLSNYLTALRRSDENQIILEKAAEVFREKLADNKLDHVSRINLANAYSRSNRIQKAEELLLEGFELKENQEIRSSLASFYSMKYDRAKADSKPLSQQLDLLLDALNFDQSHPQVYQRLMGLYAGSEKSEEDVAKIKLELRQIIASDNPSEIAHFALSSILISEGDEEKAIFHLEQARQIKRDFLFVTNNLAWIYAHKDSPELEKALKLANEAVGSRPIDGRFRDTRGSILLKMGKFKESIAEFQLSLRAPLKVENPKQIHKKLSEAYTAIGQDDLAQLHLENSQ